MSKNRPIYVQYICRECKSLIENVKVDDYLTTGDFGHIRIVRGNGIYIDTLVVGSRKNKVISICSDCKTATEERRLSKPELKRKRFDIVPCAECGNEFTPRISFQKYCSKICHNRANRTRHRAIKQKAFIAPVNRKHLFEKSSGICAFCGNQLDLSIKYPHPESVEIDHIIPLKPRDKDMPVGTHEPLNTQLLHRKCNILKSNKHVWRAISS